MSTMPVDLRARLAADYAPVRPLARPWVRALWCAPFALLAAVAAPLSFNVRSDAAQLGWLAWGASAAQLALGFAVIAAALRESVPGRSWNGAAIALWIGAPLAMSVAITLASWQLSPVTLGAQSLVVGAMCLVASAATALPVVALASVLASRAYPTRPEMAGALLGLGAGLMADAGWRMFCHFSEPAHVLPAHLGGVMVAMLAGVILSIWLAAFAKASAPKKADTTL
jgi:hypothetical protein